MSDQSTRKRRSQLMLDDDLYERLTQEAEFEGRSVSALVREAVAQWLDRREPRPIEETAFWQLVGSGDSGQTGDRPISEYVDDYLYPDPNPAVRSRVSEAPNTEL